MRLKLLAPFRCAGLVLRNEIVIDNPAGYASFWDGVERGLRTATGGSQGHAAVTDLRFTHGSGFTGGRTSRYRSIDTDSLLRPLQVLEVVVDTGFLDAGGLFGRAAAGTADLPADAPGRSFPAALRARVEEHPPAALIRVYDHTICLIELDLSVDLYPQDTGGDGLHGDEMERALDQLQQVAISFAELVVDACCREVLGPLFESIHRADVGSATYLYPDSGLFEMTAGGDRGKADPECARTLWVTRSLIFEPDDSVAGGSSGDRTVTAVVSHWLKDVDTSPDDDELPEAAVQADASSVEWLNYVFREESYPQPYPGELGWNHDADRATRGFSVEWDGMVNAQYYYAAFDTLQSVIRQVLAQSYATSDTSELRRLKLRLDDIVKESTLITLDYHENFKYYERRVHATMRKVLDGWGFEEVLLQQVQRATEACSERINELHARAASRATAFTDLILLGIGVTSVFGFLLALLDYGRTLAGDAQLATYERGSFNFVDWIGAHSTDGILLVSTFISAGLVALYMYFKRQQML